MSAVLLVADISGYTKFMKYHEISLNHAKQIIVRLLKSIINAAKPPLTVAELEGDAVFFYAPCYEKDFKKTTEAVKSQMINLFNSFKAEINILSKMDMCICPACTETGDLKLKQVVHTGEIEFEKINKSEKLFGLDVIVVHRMLKNSVPSHEYVMMTNHAYENFVDFYGLTPSLFRENFEGIGEVDTRVFYLEDILKLPGISGYEVKKPTLIKRILWFIKLEIFTILEYLKIKKLRGNFNNIPA